MKYKLLINVIDKWIDVNVKGFFATFLVLFLLVNQSGFAQQVWYEAETGTRSNGAITQACGTCSGGQQVANLGGLSNGTLVISVNAAAAGQFTLSINYLSGDLRDLYVTVNNGAYTGLSCFSGNWSTVSTATLIVNLQAGTNTIKLDNGAGGYAPNIDKIAISPKIYESEAGVLANGANVQSCSSCSGLNMAGNLGNGSVTQTVNSSTAGNYNLTVYYATNDPRSFFVTVNGIATELPCVPSGGWSTVANATIVVPLNAGNNTIKLDNPNSWAPNADKITLSLVDPTIKNISFGVGNRIEYNLNTGKYNLYFNGIKVVTDAYASAKSNITHTSTNYATRTYSSSAITDAFGTGTKHVISLSGNGLIPMQQVFYVYNGKNYFYTEIVLNGTGANSYYMAPLISTSVYLPASGDNRVLWSPFDNDTFIKYNALSLGSVNTTSSEVSAIYDNTSRYGLVLGSIEHSDWKTGIQVIGSGQNLTQLSAFGGFTLESNTRDKKGHGWVGVGSTTAKSPKIMLGYFTDWRTGLEEFGKSNRIAEPPYVFNWTQPTPFGWNSWGSIQSNLNLTNAKGVVDFFSNGLQGFRNGNTAYIDLDSYWDNLSDAELKQFADYCISKGLKPGIYWAPFVDWSKTSRIVEGSTYNYTALWTKVNGLYHDLDGCRALDPTHPGTKQRIAYMIGRFKTAGFQMIKIDFLGHAAIEADSYYDSSAQTGMQAYRKGMEYLIDQLASQMLVYAAISPNLASGRYVHTRRIACDAFSSIADTKYTLNSTNYGWWQTYVYQYIDADHMVMGNETIGGNRARVTSGVINGTLIAGDNFSATGQWTGRAQTLLQNQEILDIARNGVAFKPVEGNTGEGTSELFVRQIGAYYYLAALNYGTTSKAYTPIFSRLGLPDGTYSVKELYSGTVSSATNSLNFSLGASDAAIYRFTLGSAKSSAASVATDISIAEKPKNYLYPNPVTNILTLKSENTIVKVRIASVSTGQIVREFSKVNTKYLEMNMSKLAAGVYVVTVNGIKGEVNSYKVIKN